MASSRTHPARPKPDRDVVLCETDQSAHPPFGSSSAGWNDDSARAPSASLPGRNPGHPGSLRQTYDTLQSTLSVDKAREDKTSLSYIVRSGIAGGIAGCAAKTSVAPLDRIKILFQARNPEFAAYAGHLTGVAYAARDIWRTQGVTALFQGHSATLLRIFPYAAIKYMAYDKLHFWLMPTKRDETSTRLFVAGSMSGVLSVFCTYPLEVIRVRLAFETKRHHRRGDLMRIVRTIYTEGSTAAPFSGDVRRRGGRTAPPSGLANPTSPPAATPAPTPARMAFSAATSSLNQGALVTGAQQAQATSSSSTPAAATATAAVPSAATATGHHPRPTSQRLLTLFPVLKFYRGFSVTLMGMIPYAGTAFLVFGRTKNLLHAYFATSRDQDPDRYTPSKTVLDLFAGCIAGAISQTAAYPFEVIRRCQQIGGKTRPDALVGMEETARWIYRTSGIRGFYVGLSIGLLKVMPMSGVSFTTWLAMKRQMGI